MRLSDFDYHLPAELIAQEPSPLRDQSRLMMLDRRSGRISHHVFRDLPELLTADDLVVLNDSRVIPARLSARPVGRAGQVELLLLRPVGEKVWEALVRPGKKASTGSRLIIEEGVLEAEVLPSDSGPSRRLRFDFQGDFEELLQRLGEAPLPPYIRRAQGTSERDAERYQTVYARASGSVAAPTAGLHFTDEVLCRLDTCRITLHVGYGTFKPIKVQTVERHQMEPERYMVSPESARRINQQAKSGKRIVTVGSTTTRVLEHLAGLKGGIAAGGGETSLFIHPGFRFQLVGGLVTNFHLPRSTLLLLVSAFAGAENIQRCYRQAIEQGYRFYSYGDAMLIV